MSETSSVRMADAKSAKKRKNKMSTTTPPPAYSSAEAQTNGHAETNEHPHVRELHKQLRNANKKLAAVQKTEALVAELEGLSLEDLVAQKRINSDQKAQLEKKAGLEEQRTQIENQLKMVTDVTQDLEARHAQEKQSLVEDHKAEIEKAKEENSQNATKIAQTKVRDALHIACQFLHAAAFQRQREDVDDTESKAYEAVLFHLYQGNHTALDTITKVIEGSSDKIAEPSGEELDYTFAQLKSSALATLSEDQPEAQETIETASEEPATDPTVANAGLTELEDTAAIPISATDDVSQNEVSPVAPEQASTAADAANAVAEASWNPEASITTDNTQGEEWVTVPRDPAETETGAAATPAAQQSTSNWADEAGAAAEERGSTPVNENDGFSEVRRDRGGRGRGGRGGRGFDGRGRGRGRGEYRGGRGGRGRGGPRGAAAPQSS